jgi:hypothetical protein
MHQYSRIIVHVVGVAADVIPTINDKNPVTTDRGQAFRKDTAGESCADDNPFVSRHP